MTKTGEFDSSLYYLGKICKRDHKFFSANLSLRQKSNSTCIECQKSYKQKYKQSNYDSGNERTLRWRKQIAKRSEISCPAEKKCSVCHEVKSAGEFYPAKYSAVGLMSHCKACDKSRQNGYRLKRQKPKIYKDPEIIKENKRTIKRRYKRTPKGKLATTRNNHRRRANIIGVKTEIYTSARLMLRFAEFENKCAYCGSGEKLSVDHFVAISKSGADDIQNIVPACVFCNSSKNNNDPEFWFKKQPFFSEEKWLFLLEKARR